MGMDQPYFACDRCLSEEFVEIAGDNAEGVICAYPWNPTRKDSRLKSFHEDFLKRFGEQPETYAAHGYDGMSMLIWAIQAAGLNRAKIRDVLAYRSKPWHGVTGDIVLSAALDDVGTVAENGGRVDGVHHDVRPVVVHQIPDQRLAHAGSARAESEEEAGK